MNATDIFNKIIPFVSPNMHKTRQKALIVCSQSLAQGNMASVTNIGRGITSNAYEKHKIKRADRLLSNTNIQRESLSIYGHICRLFASREHPIISVDWSDLDSRGRHFLLRAASAFQGRTITLYEEVHTIKTKDKPRTHTFFTGT